MNSGKTALIIPCHNESGCIGSVLETLNRSFPEFFCIVVNDGSRDNTKEIVEKSAEKFPRIVLLDLPVNLGIGGAVQTGFRYAARNGFDYAVKIDGDGQHPAEQIGKLLAPVRENRADMVIGSRFLTKEGFQSTPARRVGIRFFCFLNSLLIGQTVTDNTSGFRAYGRDALMFAADHYPAFDYPEPEEVILMARNRFRICEVPVAMQERQEGVSSINLKRSVYYMIKVTFAVLMAAVRPAERREK